MGLLERPHIRLSVGTTHISVPAPGAELFTQEAPRRCPQRYKSSPSAETEASRGLAVTLLESPIPELSPGTTLIPVAHFVAKFLACQGGSRQFDFSCAAVLFP